MRVLITMALALVLALSACSRQTVTLLEVDILSLTPADDRSSTISLISVVEGTPLYLPCSDVAEPCGGVLVDVPGTGLLLEASFTLGLEVESDVALDTLDIAVYVAPASAADDVFTGGFLWGALEESEVLVSVCVVADCAAPVWKLELKAVAGSRVGDLLSSGAFRLGVKIDIESAGAVAGDDITLTLSEAELKLALNPGGLLP